MATFTWSFSYTNTTGFAQTFNGKDAYSFYMHINSMNGAVVEKPTLPATIDEIEAELDIVRGKVPTPKGYVIDKERTKLLMQKLRELKSAL